MRVGAAIRTARETKGWTQVDLAEASRVAPQVISRSERGAVTPSLESLERLANALGVPLASLIGAEPVPAPPDISASARRVASLIDAMPDRRRSHVARAIATLLAPAEADGAA